MTTDIARRKFIAALGGAAAAWPLAARAQQGEGIRRICLLQGLAENDPVAQANNAAFVQGLQQLGWTDGRNVRIDFRWGGGDAAAISKNAMELVARARRNPCSCCVCWAVVAGDPYDTDRIHDRSRSGRRRVRRKSVATRRQCDRLSEFRIQFVREMAGTAQGDRAGRDASGGPSRFYRPVRGRPVRGDPIGGSGGRRGRRVRSTCAMPPRSSAPSRRSRKPRMAA